MIDTTEVANYKAKAGVDKHELTGDQYDNRRDFSGMSEMYIHSGILNPRMGDQTPINHTPNPYAEGWGRSVLSMAMSPGPSFTPIHGRENMSFTPMHNFNPGMSPNPSMTPIMNPHFGGQTPSHNTPVYTLQNFTSMSSPIVQSSGFRSGYSQGSEMRTPIYKTMGNSSSPSYS